MVQSQYSPNSKNNIKKFFRGNFFLNLEKEIKTIRKNIDYIFLLLRFYKHDTINSFKW